MGAQRLAVERRASPARWNQRIIIAQFSAGLGIADRLLPTKIDCSKPLIRKESKMHYIVHCLDHEGAVEKRLANYDAHKAYLATGVIKTVISGPLLAEDNETMIGSLFLCEADRKEDVVAFNQNDPFSKAGVWKVVNIHPFSKRVDNR
jgi:uncharacterized protein YciI